MNKEQLKAYLIAAIDSLSEEEMMSFALPSREPDLNTFASELTVLTGEVKKMNSVSLKLNNDIQGILSNVSANQPKNEATTGFSKDHKELLDNIISLNEFFVRTQEHFSDLPVDEIYEFLAFFVEWKSKMAVLVETLNEDVEEEKPETGFSLKNLFGKSDNSNKQRLEKLENLLNQVSKMLKKSNSINFDKIQKLTGDYRIWSDGYDMYNAQWLKFMKSMGFVQTGKTREMFNPALHEAVATVNSPSHHANQITETIEMGYLYKDELIRRAKVTVNKVEQNVTVSNNEQTINI